MAYSYKMKTLFSQVTIVIKISNDFCSILNTVLLYFYDLQKCSFLYVNVTIGALTHTKELQHVYFYHLRLSQSHLRTSIFQTLYLACNSKSDINILTKHYNYPYQPF